ncbi:DNA polymerase/3'-5' exonuclease PolX [Candidatus Daviesbacteria bacterium]|nr:DNA polymerase/3'-5' exonuclease PolX [Candidatus Daviesbacteria bacterium]
MKQFSNAEVARELHEVAAAYTIRSGNLFQIRAYDSAADAIEHLTSEVKDLWEEGNLNQIPGVGESIQAHLEELFKTGKVKHWEEVKVGIPEQIFGFLEIPGIGPKTALKLAKLGVKSIYDLEDQLQTGALIKKGVSKKMAQKLLTGLKMKSRLKSSRILLPYAFAQAEKVLEYLKKSPDVEKADALGSLRRMVATVGDLDFAIASKNPTKAVEHIVKMPGIYQVVERGDTKVTVKLPSGLQLDFLILADPGSYGALLQHFTGSKQHNIHLRTIAEKMGLSLSEYGVKKVQSGEIIKCETEEEFYQLLGMQTPPPEIREDTGEIEAALRQAQGKPNGLPKLIELKDVKGDLHIHSSFPIEPSHDLGADSIEEIIKEAKRLGYSYIGISDHQPSVGNHTPAQIISLIEKRTKLIEHINYSHKDIRVLNLLEVDITPSGEILVPEEALKMLDFVIAGVHSVHHQPKEELTKRILKALENPYVKVLSHPTNRLLNEREASDADWPEVFKLAAANNKALEINSFPNRLDLPDGLIKEAKSLGVKFVINTDSHEVNQMENMKFGIAVARRGWLEASDVINSWDFKKFAEWFKI